MLNASFCNTEPESASEILCMEYGDLRLEVYPAIKNSHHSQPLLETILLAVSAERSRTAQMV